MAHWIKTKTPGVYVSHSLSCPSRRREARCRCEPSWRGRRRNAATGRPEWQKPVTKDRNEVLVLARRERQGRRRSCGAGHEGAAIRGASARVAGRRRGGPHRPAQVAVSPTARRRSPTTGARTATSSRPEFGADVADEITEVDWQLWVDRLSREGLSRSRIATTSRSRRRSTPGRRADAPVRAAQPAAAVELPPNDEKPRMRVASRPRPRSCWPRSSPTTAPVRARVLRRPAPRGDLPARWEDVLDGCIASRLLVRERRAPPARTAGRRSPSRCARSSREAWLRQGRPTRGRVLERSVMSGKLAAARRTRGARPA